MSVRYGVKLRKKHEKIRKKQKLLYPCSKCGKKRVKRIDFAQWECKSCGVVFAGGAYEPYTSIGAAAKSE